MVTSKAREPRLSRQREKLSNRPCPTPRLAHSRGAWQSAPPFDKRCEPKRKELGGRAPKETAWQQVWPARRIRLSRPHAKRLVAAGDAGSRNDCPVPPCAADAWASLVARAALGGSHSSQAICCEARDWRPRSGITTRAALPPLRTLGQLAAAQARKSAVSRKLNRRIVSGHAAHRRSAQPQRQAHRRLPAPPTQIGPGAHPSRTDDRSTSFGREADRSPHRLAPRLHMIQSDHPTQTEDPLR